MPRKAPHRHRAARSEVSCGVTAGLVFDFGNWRFQIFIERVEEVIGAIVRLADVEPFADAYREIAHNAFRIRDLANRVVSKSQMDYESDDAADERPGHGHNLFTFDVAFCTRSAHTSANSLRDSIPGS